MQRFVGRGRARLDRRVAQDLARLGRPGDEVDVVRRHAGQRLVLHPRLIDHLGIDEVHRQVLRRPVLHQLHQVLFRQLRRADHEHADSVAVGHAVQRIGVLAREEIRQPLARRRFDEIADESRGFRVGLPLVCLC